jgi:glutamine synthetase
MRSQDDLPHGIHTVELAVPDAFGILRGKRVPASAWPGVVENGARMASVIYTWTPRCEIREDDEWLDPAKGWPDLRVLPLIDQLRAVPWRPGSAQVICDTRDADGVEIPVSPRAALQRVLGRAARMGFEVRIGLELEFYLLDPATGLPRHDDIQCYGLARAAEYEDVLAPIRNQLIEFGIPVEASNTEYAPGQVEVNVRYDEALRTADNAILFRNAVKEIAAQHGYLATFMAKVHHAQSGSGTHVHHSLWRDGRWYLGGLMKHMAELTLFGSPTPNSYKRRQPYSFCPQNVSWGHDNRTVGLRVIEGHPSAVRIEQRDGASDANPYLILAAQISAGLQGIEHQLDPGPPTDSDAYADAAAQPLPATVPEAIAALQKSDLAREVFGELLVSVVSGIARHEHNHVTSQVSDVERNRYLETF